MQVTRPVAQQKCKRTAFLDRAYETLTQRHACMLRWGGMVIRRALKQVT